MKFRHGVIVGAVITVATLTVTAVSVAGAICTRALAEEPTPDDEFVTPITPAQEA